MAEPGSEKSSGGFIDSIHEGSGVFIAGNYRSVRHNDSGSSSYPKFLRKFQIIVYRRCLTFRWWEWFFCKGILQKSERFFTYNCLRLPIGIFMHRQRIQLYIKGYILSFLQHLLHLLMKFYTVGSVWIREDDNSF